METSFKKGDRVHLRLRPSMGNDEPMQLSLRNNGFSLGDTGTIIDDGGYRVVWDNGNRDPGWNVECLELAPPEDIMLDTRDYLKALEEFT